jgi:hypothetical protein
MAEWWSIEVFHSDLQRASRWKDAYSSALIESAISHGALEWAWIDGGAGARSPRRPRPTAGAGAIELPEPENERLLDLTAHAAPALFGDLCPTM